MFRKDLMTSEMQKLAQALARIFGLRIEGFILEADEIIKQTLEDDFKLTFDELENLTNGEFDSYLRRIK